MGGCVGRCGFIWPRCREHPWLAQKAWCVGCCHSEENLWGFQLARVWVAIIVSLAFVRSYFFLQMAASTGFVLDRGARFPLPSRRATNSASRIPATRTKLLINSHSPSPSTLVAPFPPNVLQLRDNRDGDGAGGKTDKREKKTKAREED